MLEVENKGKEIAPSEIPASRLRLGGNGIKSRPPTIRIPYSQGLVIRFLIIWLWQTLDGFLTTEHGILKTTADNNNTAQRGMDFD